MRIPGGRRERGALRVVGQTEQHFQHGGLTLRDAGGFPWQTQQRG